MGTNHQINTTIRKNTPLDFLPQYTYHRRIPEHTIHNMDDTNNTSSKLSPLKDLAKKLEVIQKINPELATEFAQTMIEKMEAFQQSMINISGEYLHGDEIHDEDPEKVRTLINAVPQALTVKNEEGSLPKLSLMLKYGVKWTEELSGLIHEQGSALGTISDDDGLYPYLQAIVGECELSIVYDLLRRYPDALVQSLSTCTSRACKGDVDDDDSHADSKIASCSSITQENKRAKTDQSQSDLLYAKKILDIVRKEDR